MAVPALKPDRGDGSWAIGYQLLVYSVLAVSPSGHLAVFWTTDRC